MLDEDIGSYHKSVFFLKTPIQRAQLVKVMGNFIWLIKDSELTKNPLPGVSLVHLQHLFKKGFISWVLNSDLSAKFHNFVFY